MIRGLADYVDTGKCKIWVLAPQVETQDPNIDYYYDFSQSIAEYTNTFRELALNWVWQPVTMATMTNIIQAIRLEQEQQDIIPIVLNLCDGDEVNGSPGISVIHLLEEQQLIYTGANAFFYEITTSKIPMKTAFDAAGVATAPWAAIHQPEADLEAVLAKTGVPVIVKPAVSGGSMGLGIRNVVSDLPAMRQLVQDLFGGYRGWDLTTDGLIAEQFITGPEFTTLIVGDSSKPEACTVYQAVERVFHASLPPRERFLSFDRLWEIYEEETPMPADENFYEYRIAAKTLQEQIRQLSLDAYCAVGGVGYTRVDLRMDEQTGKLMVLEVNAQCGLSEDEDYTSIGAILKASQTSFTHLITAILIDACQRHARKISPAHSSLTH
jgi:D-alanine-D-alanine ligase